MTANTIPMQACTSSQIKAYGYDAATKTLAVQFNRGTKVYHYPGFEPADYEAFHASESKGTHFGKHIKGREFTYVDLPEKAEAQG